MSEYALVKEARCAFSGRCQRVPDAESGYCPRHKFLIDTLGSIGAIVADASSEDEDDDEDDE